MIPAISRHSGERIGASSVISALPLRVVLRGIFRLDPRSSPAACLWLAPGGTVSFHAAAELMTRDSHPGVRRGLHPLPPGTPSVCITLPHAHWRRKRSRPPEPQRELVPHPRQHPVARRDVGAARDGPDCERDAPEFHRCRRHPARAGLPLLPRAQSSPRHLCGLRLRDAGLCPQFADHVGGRREPCAGAGAGG